MQLTCPSCKSPILETYFYCPNCGKMVKRKPPSTSLSKQISLYLFCIFFPPFGAIPGLRYLSQEDSKSKTIGGVALVLTTVSLILTVVFTVQFVNQVQSSIKQQEKMYQNLGL